MACAHVAPYFCICNTKGKSSPWAVQFLGLFPIFFWFLSRFVGGIGQPGAFGTRYFSAQGVIRYKCPGSGAQLRCLDLLPARPDVSE